MQESEQIRSMVLDLKDLRHLQKFRVGRSPIGNWDLQLGAQLQDRARDTCVGTIKDHKWCDIGGTLGRDGIIQNCEKTEGS